MANAPLYKPPTRVTTLEIPWLAQVTRADPNWARFKFYEVEFEFTRRNFFCNYYTSGPYNPVFDNPIYPLNNALITDDGDVILTDDGQQILVNP